jgi:hypothetical protein
MAGQIIESGCASIQCFVARHPSRSPPAAKAKAPEQIEPTQAPFHGHPYNFDDGFWNRTDRIQAVEEALHGGNPGRFTFGEMSVLTDDIVKSGSRPLFALPRAHSSL